MSISEREIVRWAVYLRAAGRPETTIYLRTYQVRRVMREIDKDPWSLTTEDLVEYLGSKLWAAETRRSYRSALRMFYRWAQITGRRLDDPAGLLPEVRLPRSVPRPTPDLIYREALHEATVDPRASRLRVRLMVQLAAVAGLRRGEISRVRREDLLPDLVGYSLRVVGKGGHIRMVPLDVAPDVVRQILDSPPGWLFPSNHRDRSGQPLSPEYVGKLVSSVLPAGWTCHTLRHRCATVAYAAERDLRAVQDLLGHAKPETTARYTQVPMDAVRRAVAAAAA